MSRLLKSMAAVFALALAFASLASVAGAQDPARHGRALLQEHCASCHSIGKTGRSPHNAAPPFRTLGRSFDLDRFTRRLRQGISAGHPDMPTFRFSENDAEAVTAYLRGIQE